MSPHLLIVAIEFRIAGLLLGLPSLAALAGLIYTGVDLATTPLPPPDNSEYLDVQTYGLAGALQNGGKGVGAILGKLLELLSGAALWVIALLSVVTLLATLFAVLLYVTGRGIGQHAGWARIVAIVLAAGLLLVSIGVLALLRRDLALLAGLPIGLSLYTLWVLGWRFA
jgi:hypothetical protein